MAQMNRQPILIREFMYYKFELGHTAAKAINQKHLLCKKKRGGGLQYSE